MTIKRGLSLILFSLLITIGYVVKVSCIYFSGVFAIVLCLYSSSFSYAESCTVGDLENGDWVEITEHVPEGNCLDTQFVRRYNSGGTIARYYLEGRSERFRILIPTSASGVACYYYQQPTGSCNCNDWHDDSIAADAYPDCWGISYRCSGDSCSNSYTNDWGVTVPAPHCTECWSSSCWHIQADNYDHRRRVEEWVCNSCATEYGEKLLECGEKKIINWDNETCTGQCDPCVDEYNAKIEECGSVQNIIYWNDETCEGACLPQNLGPPQCKI